MKEYHYTTVWAGSFHLKDLLIAQRHICLLSMSDEFYSLKRRFRKKGLEIYSDLRATIGMYRKVYYCWEFLIVKEGSDCEPVSIHNQLSEAEASLKRHISLYNKLNHGLLFGDYETLEMSNTNHRRYRVSTLNKKTSSQIFSPQKMKVSDVLTEVRKTDTNTELKYVFDSYLLLKNIPIEQSILEFNQLVTLFLPNSEHSDSLRHCLFSTKFILQIHGGNTDFGVMLSMDIPSNFSEKDKLRLGAEFQPSLFFFTSLFSSRYQKHSLIHRAYSSEKFELSEDQIPELV